MNMNKNERKHVVNRNELSVADMGVEFGRCCVGIGELALVCKNLK